MKILNVISWGYETGGAESHVRATNALLRDRGHEVVTLASDSGPTDLRFDDFQFRSVPTSGVTKPIFTIYNPHASRKARAVAASFAPDIVVFHTLTQATVSTVMALRGIPSVLCVHGPEHYTLSLLQWTLMDRDFKDDSRDLTSLTWRGWLHYSFFRYLCRPLYRRAFKQVDQIVAYSTYTQRLLAAEGLSAHYLPMGISPLSYVEPDFDSCDVLFVGRIVTLKGVFVLIDAFEEVVRDVPHAKLTIAGEGERRRELEETIARRGLGSSVQILGHVPARDMAEIYGKSSVVVVPSFFPEAFGKVGVEALSVGRPVVVSDVGGVRDWLDDGVNGVLVRPGESGELAGALTGLLKDPERAQRMSRAGPKMAEQFSLELHVERFEQLLERIVREAG